MNTDTSIFCNGFYSYGWVIDSSELSPYKLKLFSGNMFQIIQLSEFYCSMWGWLHTELHYVTHENMRIYVYLWLILYFSLCNVQYIMNFHLPCIRSSMNLSASLDIFVNMHTSYKCLQMLLFMLDFPPSSNIFKMMWSLNCE